MVVESQGPSRAFEPNYQSARDGLLQTVNGHHPLGNEYAELFGLFAISR